MATDKSGTVAKAVTLLDALGDHPHGATVSEIAESAGYPFSTVYRLLNTLVHTGFLVFEPSSRKYRLGLRVFQLGQKVAHARGFSGTALPALEHLTDETGESSIMAVLDGDRCLTVHTVDGPKFRQTTDPGDYSPLHTSAIGKCLLAFADDRQREHLLATLELTPRTANSITDRDVLRAQIDTIREQGWAGQQEENDQGMAALAAPIRSGSARHMATVALAAPLFRQDLATLQQFVPELQRVAGSLAAELPQQTGSPA